MSTLTDRNCVGCRAVRMAIPIRSQAPNRHGCRPAPTGLMSHAQMNHPSSMWKFRHWFANSAKSDVGTGGNSALRYVRYPHEKFRHVGYMRTQPSNCRNLDCSASATVSRHKSTLREVSSSISLATIDANRAMLLRVSTQGL